MVCKLHTSAFFSATLCFFYQDDVQNDIVWRQYMADPILTPHPMQNRVNCRNLNNLKKVFYKLTDRCLPFFIYVYPYDRASRQIRFLINCGDFFYNNFLSVNCLQRYVMLLFASATEWNHLSKSLKSWQIQMTLNGKGTCFTCCENKWDVLLFLFIQSCKTKDFKLTTLLLILLFLLENVKMEETECMTLIVCILKKAFVIVKSSIILPLNSEYIVLCWQPETWDILKTLHFISWNLRQI